MKAPPDRLRDLPASPGETAEFAAAIRRGDPATLARAITLVESSSPRHREAAAELMRCLLPATDGATRVGITGVPGVGKSTFIESLGLHLCEAGHRVAVLAVDPTSAISGGSILGDKTRMESLSRHPAAYIRPSPSSGALGGVTRKTRETIALCEAAGYNVILVETVGVGQSEIAVRSMTDFFLLLTLTGAGDELQGIKKGIVEMADAIVVTKADGDNAAGAELLRAELTQVLRLLTPATPGWKPPVLCCSALKGTGIGDVWGVVEGFREAMTASGEWAARRLVQAGEGLSEFARENVMTAMARNPQVAAAIDEWSRRVNAGDCSLRDAAGAVAAAFLRRD